MVDLAPDSAAPPPLADVLPHSRQARLGLWLCGLYVLVYAGFVLMNAFAPQAMAATPWAGINLAVLYGLGLICAAFVLALVYEWLCRRLERIPLHDKEVRP